MDGIVEYPLISADEMAAEAWAAMSRQDSAEALRLWQRLREYFPERPEGHICPVQVFWQAGLLDEADAAAAGASARFPDDPELLVQYAWIAMQRQRWDEALTWWAKARSLAPQRADPYIWAARALWQSGRLDDAEAMAKDAVERFPDNVDAAIERAWVAVARRDWNEASRRWTEAIERSPERADAHIGATQAARMVGRIDTAEAMSRAALARFPENDDVLVEHVWTAVAREDWPAAAARLETARARFRDAERFERLLGGIEIQVRSRSEPTTRDGVMSSSDEISVGDLMLAFESLGERCDFGAVQRKYGVEPLGLLRFAFTRYEPLIVALEDRFAAVGTPGDTSYELYNDENILYMRKYGLIFHTFVYQSELPTEAKRAAFQQQQQRRLAFLRDKLVADLEEPQKIYIYSSEERAADADARRLFAALRAYGPNSLLYVRPATAGRPEGMVELIDDGLFVGYFAGLADFVGGAQPPFELWRQLCEKTFRLSRPNRT